MATTAETAKAYFAALARHDVDAAVALWKRGGVDRVVGERDLIAPHGVHEYFTTLFAAFPDFTFEIVDLTTSRGRTAVRWKANATFAGPGRFQGFAPNRARVSIEGCDVVSVEQDQIAHNEAYFDSADVARQLGVLPPLDSPAQRRMASLVNLRTRALLSTHAGHPEVVADGVWLIRGGFPLRTMNVYLLEDGDQVTVFDAGIDGMGAAIYATAARHGGIARVVLGHADADHRGAAGSLGAPILCHPAEREAAQAPDPRRPYHDISRLRAYARPFYQKMFPTWDGGPLTIAGEVAEGDEIAGFRVVELPGHAPGLIGLYRESDGLALCSDTVYTLDIQTGRKGGPRIPHPAFDADIDQARASIDKLADMEPRVVWAGHCDPVSGDVVRQLRAAARAPLPA